MYIKKFMKLHEYPSQQELADGLKKLTGKEILPTKLVIKEPEWMKINENISPEVAYILTYLATNKKTGRVQVTVQPKTWDTKKSTKEFDAEMETQDVENKLSYTHKLPIYAFRSAISEIIHGI